MEVGILSKEEEKKEKLLISYTSLPIQKLHPHSDIIFQLYKPAFHDSYLSHNIPYSSATTIQVFCFS